MIAFLFERIFFFKRGLITEGAYYICFLLAFAFYGLLRYGINIHVFFIHRLDLQLS